MNRTPGAFRLDTWQTARVESARRALEASRAEESAARYPYHLGTLEVITGHLLEIIDALAAPASGQSLRK